MKELALPPVKIHCSVLAEDAIRAAIGDWKKKNAATAKQPQHSGGRTADVSGARTCARKETMSTVNIEDSSQNAAPAATGHSR